MNVAMNFEVVVSAARSTEARDGCSFLPSKNTVNVLLSKTGAAMVSKPDGSARERSFYMSDEDIELICEE